MKLLMTIGVPGCGKSTYIRPLAEAQNLAYINPDSIREEVHGDPTDHSNEPLVWKIVRKRIAAALKSSGAVLDATNTRRSGRKEFIKMAQNAEATEITGYWFTTPLDTCKKRNAGRDRKVPTAAIEAMYNRLTLNPPTLDEGFTKIIEVK